MNGWMKEGNVIFNDALNTFYLRPYGVRHMVNDHSYSERGNAPPPLHGLIFPIEKLIYVSIYTRQPRDQRPTKPANRLVAGYFQLAARDLLYAPFHKQGITYQGLCYTSCGGLAGTKYSSMGPP